MAADLHTCLAEMRAAAGVADEAGESSRTQKLPADGEPTVGAPPAAAIAMDTRLPVSRHFDCTVALRRLSKSQNTGHAPRPVGILRRIVSDAPARRVFVFTLLGALAGTCIALV
jgi:hypothetical protein